MADRWPVYAQIAPPHDPIRPSWLCARDGRSWPCDVARVQLAAELHPADLSTALSEQLTRAARDMPDTTPAELHERFVGWVPVPVLTER
ncbi:hypothetical protein ACIA8K_07130 [Catenuloplanes sp. NPDC051500]|uniref:hypothetical protein n=1 Tax=Catenuloplanes sp. NPDC051500 TaxID=3363959 RepID=UPI0037B09C82